MTLGTPSHRSRAVRRRERNHHAAGATATCVGGLGARSVSPAATRTLLTVPLLALSQHVSTMHANRRIGDRISNPVGPILTPDPGSHISVFDVETIQSRL